MIARQGLAAGIPIAASNKAPSGLADGRTWCAMQVDVCLGSVADITAAMDLVRFVLSGSL